MRHAARPGKGLGQSVDAYNDFVGSYERRLGPVMQRFEDGGVKSAEDLPEVPEVSVRPRAIDAALFALPGPDTENGHR